VDTVYELSQSICLTIDPLTPYILIPTRNRVKNVGAVNGLGSEACIGCAARSLKKGIVRKMKPSVLTEFGPPLGVCSEWTSCDFDLEKTHETLDSPQVAGV
jgi:hypothetical protein